MALKSTIAAIAKQRRKKIVSVNGSFFCGKGIIRKKCIFQRRKEDETKTKLNVPKFIEINFNSNTVFRYAPLLSTIVHIKFQLIIAQ